jgi:hypothetical protein
VSRYSCLNPHCPDEAAILSAFNKLWGKQRQERYASVYANQRNSAFCGLDRLVRACFVGGDGDLPLPNPVNGAILPAKTPGIWPMSANRRIEAIDLIKPP